MWLPVWFPSTHNKIYTTLVQNYDIRVYMNWQHSELNEGCGSQEIMSVMCVSQSQPQKLLSKWFTDCTLKCVGSRQRHFGAPNLPKVVKLSQGRREPLHQSHSLRGTHLPIKAALLGPNVIQVRIMHVLQPNRCWLVVAVQRFHSTKPANSQNCEY